MTNVQLCIPDANAHSNMGILVDNLHVLLNEMIYLGVGVQGL